MFRNNTTSLSHTMVVEESADLEDCLEMTIDFNWLFQQEGVKDRDLKGLIEFLADYSCENTLSTVVWESLVEVKSALEGDIDHVNEMRLHRKERWNDIYRQQRKEGRYSQWEGRIEDTELT